MMEEILQNLIKSYSEKRPEHREFKFYSNLSITQPYQQHTDTITRLTRGISFLEKSFNSQVGYQSKVYLDGDFTLKEINKKSNHNNILKCEQLTNILAFELFGEGLECGIKINPNILKELKNLIIPEAGISTFNLFKNIEINVNATNSSSSCDDDYDEATTSSDISSNGSKEDIYFPLVESPVQVLEELSEGDSATGSSIPEEESSNNIPDDCNTTSLAVSLLLREGILDYNPVASITELILSNTIVPKKAKSESINLEGSIVRNPGVIRTFMDCQSIDPITCANVLYLYYLTDMDLNYEENVESTEIFLVKTLSRLVTLEGTTGIDHQQLDCKDQIDEKSFLQLQLHPNSVDSLIYYLSRVTSISSHAKDLFDHLLITLLDQRIGLPSSPLDLAMRILAADELGLLTNEIDTKIRNCICKDYEAIVALQNEDGSWPEDILFSITKISEIGVIGEEESLLFYGGKEISTMFAVKALDVYYECKKTVKSNEKHLKDYLY